jgi:hypothetical protein
MTKPSRRASKGREAHSGLSLKPVDSALSRQKPPSEMPSMQASVAPVLSGQGRAGVWQRQECMPSYQGCAAVSCNVSYNAVEFSVHAQESKRQENAGVDMFTDSPHLPA